MPSRKPEPYDEVGCLACTARPGQACRDLGFPDFVGWADTPTSQPAHGRRRTAYWSRANRRRGASLAAATRAAARAEQQAPWPPPVTRDAFPNYAEYRTFRRWLRDNAGIFRPTVGS